jgi:hypothetical protein
MDLSIIPECYVDTNLIETLVPPQTHYNHQKGCGTVTKVMQERFADRFALGIIDKDKREVKYLNDFQEVCKSGSLVLHKHKTRHHYIIQIRPAIERFIIAGAVAVGIVLTDFDLPSDFELLKRESKKTNSKNDTRFKYLFKSLIQKGAPEVLKLESWVRYLKENTYQVDLATLQKM